MYISPLYFEKQLSNGRLGLPLWCFPRQVVEFLQVQLSVHHPLGAHTDEEGAWASNDVTWNVSHTLAEYFEILYPLVFFSAEEPREAL